MDLLKTYDSDSDSERDALPNVNVDSRSTNIHLPLAPTKPSMHSILRNKSNTAEKSKPLSKKGKKLLKLNAVLPKEILERLQRNDEVDDSSDDENDVKKPKTSVALPKKHAMKDSSDDGISSLLLDLQSVVPSDSAAEKKKPPEDKIGRAFMISSSTIMTKQQSGQVVDIHASNNTTSKKIQAEDVSSESENETEAIKYQKKEDGDDTEDNTTGKLQNPSNMQQQQYSRKATNIRRAMDAAPKVSNMNPVVYITNIRPSHPPIPAFQDASDESYNISKPSSARSSREIKKALRQGNFDSIESLTSQTIDTREYDIPDEERLLATSGIAVEGSSSFRTSGLERYVPSEGMTLQGGVAGKMKSKSQIHSLVSTAASYEANMRRMTAMGLNQSKSGRGDAKRKYGW